MPAAFGDGQNARPPNDTAAGAYYKCVGAEARGFKFA